MGEKQIREFTIRVTAEEPNLESVSDIIKDVRSKPGVISAGVLELEEKSQTLQNALERVLNLHSAESVSHTPDYILAEYLINCLKAWNAGSKLRDQWYGEVKNIGQVDASQSDAAPHS
jgi:hypothetical protein